MKHRYNVKRLVKNLLFSATLGFIMMPNLGYSQQVTYSFATCGVTGSVGPTQAQVNTFYATSNLNGSVTISGQGIQQFTVPLSGPYRITAAGSSAGGSIGSYGFRGRIVQGEIFLTAGTVLKILVGQRGVTGSTSTGGGGGSYVSTLTNSAIIVGGGGGGYIAFDFGSLSGYTASVTGGNNGTTTSASLVVIFVRRIHLLSSALTTIHIAPARWWLL